MIWGLGEYYSRSSSVPCVICHQHFPSKLHSKPLQTFIHVLKCYSSDVNVTIGLTATVDRLVVVVLTVLLVQQKEIYATIVRATVVTGCVEVETEAVVVSRVDVRLTFS